MDKSETGQLIKLMIQEFNEEKRERFRAVGGGGHYSEEQKKYAFTLVAESGVRSTARILQIPRRTIQRWCRTYNIPVKRCPVWVYGWAERRRKRREFWARRGFGY